MPSKARQKKIMEKLNRAQKCSILGPQNLGSGGPRPPGPPWIRTWKIHRPANYLQIKIKIGKRKQVYIFGPMFRSVLPHVNEVWGKVMLLHLSVSHSVHGEGAAMMSLPVIDSTTLQTAPPCRQHSSPWTAPPPDRTTLWTAPPHRQHHPPA